MDAFEPSSHGLHIMQWYLVLNISIPWKFVRDAGSWVALRMTESESQEVGSRDFGVH